MRLLTFTAPDLEANRRGELGATQLERLKKLRRNAALTGAVMFIALVLLATTFLFAGARGGAGILTLIGMLLTVINAIGIGFIGRHIMRINADLNDRQVETISGELERVIRPQGRMNNLLLRVNGVDFAVKKEIFRAFQHEQPYHVYRAPHTRILLAAEPAAN